MDKRDRAICQIDQNIPHFIRILEPLNASSIICSVSCKMKAITIKTQCYFSTTGLLFFFYKKHIARFQLHYMMLPVNI